MHIKLFTKQLNVAKSRGPPKAIIRQLTIGGPSFEGLIKDCNFRFPISNFQY